MQCRYGARPLIVQGPGAGGDLTAMGVTVSSHHSDIDRLADVWRQSDMLKIYERLTTRRA